MRGVARRTLTFSSSPKQEATAVVTSGTEDIVCFKVEAPKGADTKSRPCPGFTRSSSVFFCEFLLLFISLLGKWEEDCRRCSLNGCV